MKSDLNIQPPVAGAPALARSAPLAAPGSAIHPAPRWERIAVTALLALFAIVGLNAIGNDAFEGQDYGFHVASTLRLVHHPDAWFAQDITNRPLIYWIGVNGFHLTSGRAPFAFASAVFLLLNTGALWLLYDCTRRFIARPALRLACLALVAFLPATLVTTVVYAADAMVQPPFALLCWSLLRWHEAATDRESIAFATLGGLALAIGNFAKFTFILLPVGVLALAFLAWRWHGTKPRRLLALLLLAAVVPTGVGLWLHHKASQTLVQRPDHHRFNWKGTGEMTWRSLLLPRWSDWRIFEAPGYWDPEYIDGKRYLPLLRENDYSYPALLHLGTFTDVLDFSHGGSQRSGRPRPEPQKTFSQWAVRLGVLFSVPAVLAVALATLRTVRAAITLRSPPPFGLAVWLVLGLNWFLPLVLTLPYVHYAYQWGYWLPRLVIPGLWAFAVCLFFQFHGIARSRPHVGWLVAVVAGLQTLLAVRSVWY